MPRVPRSYAALVAASILGPALLLAAFAWWSWQRVQTEASAGITRTVDILAEQGLRLLQIDQLLLEGTDARTAGLSRSELIGQQAELHAFLRGAAAQIPEVDALFIADADGKPLVTSRDTQPARDGGAATASGSIADRAYFKAAAAGAPFAIDGPNVSRASGEIILNVARRLVAPDGSFRGVAVVVLRNSLLAQGWRGVAQPGDAIALVRDDGRFLARYPDLPRVAVAPRPDGRVLPRLLSAESGLFDAAPQPFDGISRRIGFRKLAPYPVYITYGVDEANIVGQWYPMIAAFAVLSVAAAAGLLLASLAVIRRGRSEAAALTRAESSEASQRALFRKAPAAMHALNAERRIIDVNDRWLDLFGYDRDEVMGRPITDLYLAVDDAERAARWQEIVAQGTVRDSERQCCRRSGEVFDALISATIVRDPDGRFARVITTVTDITQRKRAEEAARRAQNFAELLIESSIDGIIVKDLELRYTVWNGSMEAITGLPRDAVLGRTTAEALPSVAGTRIERAWRDALEGRTTSLHEEPYGFPERGRHGQVDQIISPLRDAEGTILGALAMVRDVTERRRMEDMVRQAQKMEAVGQLTGGIAHDFNNLLTVILGNLEAMQRRDIKDPEIRRFAEAAQSGAERAATLTQRLLAFSRRQPLDPRPLDPNRLVAGMSDLLRRALGETVALETVLAGGLWRIAADANQLESALLNLAVNARDAMADGRRLAIETANALLDEDYAAAHEDVSPGQYVLIAVSDSGLGMTPEVQARAFEPFYTTKDVGRGSGLGLSQVYGFVKQSGGHVKIYSELGAGTTVRLYLPRLAGDTAPAAAAESDSVDPPATGSGTILVVEDDEQVRDHTSRLLRELGYRVVEAADGGAALGALEDERDLSLLFTDVGLPGGFNGRQLADEVTRRRPGIKVLFTTGYARTAIIHEGRLDAGVQLIVKPFTFTGLAAKVRQVLDGG
jgi:PAS domain S-box-containing protein